MALATDGAVGDGAAVGLPVGCSDISGDGLTEGDDAGFLDGCCAVDDE